MRLTNSPFGPVISVEPKKPNSARMTFTLSQDESEVAGTIGIDVPVEISATQSRYCSLAGLDEFAALASAVVHRGFLEKVWRQWNWVTKSRATIVLEGRPITIWNSTIWRVPFYASEVVEVRHEPY